MRTLLVALSTLLVLGTASAGAQTDADFKTTVSKMEQAVFGRTDPSKPLVSRVKALELEAFAKPQGGSLKQRVAALQKTIGLSAQASLPPVAPAFGSGPAVKGSTEGNRTEKADPIPTAPDAGVLRARLLHGIKMHKEGNVSGAEKVFREILVTNPYDPDACFSLGSICEGRGDLIGAVGYYRAAAMSNPSDREAHEAVAAIEEKMALEQGPFVNPLSGTPVLQARASEVTGIQPLNLQPAQPLVLTPAPPLSATGYVAQPRRQVPTVGVTQNTPGRPSTKAAVARAVATMAARTALQYTPLHCPLCNLIRF